MVAQSIVILSLLITYALSAPTGCIESCISYVKQYQTQTSGGLSQTASNLQGLDYSKPGTWSEHNDYDIDNGHGKVHEERGQYVTGPKTVRYYRKNSSSSYSTKYPNGEILSDFEYQNNRHGIHLPNTQEVFNSHNTYNQMGNSESVAQHKYNKIQSQQHTRSSYTKGERLEDLGEYSGRSQVIPQSTSNLNTQILQEPYHFNGQHGNWSTVDSYKTDGGRGHVFEEEGQYVSGPQKVRYYKRNYTSSYSSSDGIPIPKITKIGMHDVHQKLEKIEKEIGQEFKHISTAEAVGSTNIGQAHISSHDLSIDNMHNINNNNYRRQHNHRNSLSTTHSGEQHSSDIRNEHLPYRNPYQNTYGANSYSTYERHEEYAQKLQPTSQLINPTSGYTSVLNTGNSGYNRNIYSGSTSQQQTDNYQQAEMLDAHQSRQIAQTQTFLDNLRNNAQSQSSRIQSGMQGVSHYKEHWNASHTKEVSIPQHITDISHMNQHSLQYNNNQYNNRHNLHQGVQQQDSYLHQFEEGGFTHGKKMLDKLISGVDTVDCDYNSQYTQSTSQYSRKYKRNAKYGKQDEVQQTQSKYINDDLTQQTSGKLEFGQDSQQFYQAWKPQGANQQLGDFTQKTGESDDLTQQTSGNFEFGQDSQQSYQPWKPQGADQQLGDFTQKTGESDDLTQQTFGKLEFGQDSQQSYQPWKPQGTDQQLGDFMQKTGESDDLTQQTSGKLEFGQDSQQSYQPWKRYSVNHHTEDLTQKAGRSNDFTQQPSGKLKLDQESQSHKPWNLHNTIQQLEDLIQKTKESDDLTHQTPGNIEFDQELQKSDKPWNIYSTIQQLEDFIQKTRESHDFTQQTFGNLKFGQESQKSDTSLNIYSTIQQLEDLIQKTRESDDFTQQTSGKLEFSQESQQSQKTWNLQDTIQQLEDLIQKTRESNDPTLQSSEKVEFGQNSQQSHQSWKPQSTSQQLEDFTQKTGKFDDFTQQTSGKLEFGQDSQQSYQPWKPESASQQLGDFTQKTGESDDLTQQNSGELEFGQDSQQSFQPWKPESTSQQLGDFAQKTGESDDFTQQTFGKLEFGQDSQQSYQPWKPQSTNQQLRDFAQKTGESDDLTQQTSGNLEFGQGSKQSFPIWQSNVRNQKWGHLTQETSAQLEGDLPKPAEKPKPRSRYSRRGSTVNTQVSNQDMYNINTQNNLNLNAGDTDAPNIYELPPQVNIEGDKDNIRRQSTRGDQGQDKDVSKKLSQQAESSGYDVEGGNVDQVNWLHKSNDATVGLQWHYTYHPSDQRQFVQQTDQKNKEDLQQRSIQTQFSNLQQNPKQEEQIKYIVDNSDQQESHWQPQNYATEQGIKSVRKPFRYIQHENKLMSDQQIRENENLQKHVGTASSEPKLEPRILEVYGGGQYDPTHSGDIYSAVTINPSATLSPTSNTDPWDIREKPEIMVTTTELTMPPLPVEPLNTNDTNEPPRPSSLWTRIGHKITTTFDKAKEKARNIFG
ncbi:myb-like protein AA isoform X14 [Bombus affinis]|uniref:myb-like protein AA isoform X14 n=1 Tax=Bombus affinis TaxID=309941 RepID=UPI0021B7E301|nr:myb-like protein AA isoform X14 [Bombus affinis]